MGVFLGLLFMAITLAGVAGAVFFLIQAKGITTKGNKVVSNVKGKKIKALIFGIVAGVFLILFIFIPFGFKQIDTGEIAVVKVWGEATGTKRAGMHFRNVISTKYEVYDAKVQQLEIKTEVYTMDAQPSTVELIVQFKIDDANVLNISKTYGDMDTLKSRVEKMAIEKAKVVLATRTAMKLIETRAELSPAVQTSIGSEQDKYFIIVESAVITDMAFSDAFEKAVEDKMIAEQKQLEAEYAKKQAIIKAEEEAETARIKAEANLIVAIKEAEVALAKAKGEADAQVEIAQGAARALKLQTIEVARMLGFEVVPKTVNAGTEDEYIEYEIDFDGKNASDIAVISEYIKFINYLEVWDGKLPTVIGDGSSLGGIIITP